MLLQALGGRLQPSHRLRISGEVKYNGQPLSDFNVARSSGLVDQCELLGGGNVVDHYRHQPLQHQRWVVLALQGRTKLRVARCWPPASR